MKLTRRQFGNLPIVPFLTEFSAGIWPKSQDCGLMPISMIPYQPLFRQEATLASHETFWRVAQSLSNLLPLQSREKQLLDGLLGRRDVLERQVAVHQASLFDEGEVQQ